MTVQPHHCYGCTVKTTLVIDDHILERVRAEAVRQHTSMSSVVEAALRRMIDAVDQQPQIEFVPLPSWRGGRPLVDVADRDALDGAMGGR